MRDDLKSHRSELKTFREQAIKAEAQSLLKTALQWQNCQMVVKVFAETERDVDSVRALAQEVITQPNAVALFGISGDRAQIICGRAENLSFSVVPALQAALRTLGTDRGGGRPNFAQGGGIGASMDQVVAAFSAAQAALGL